MDRTRTKLCAASVLLGAFVFGVCIPEMAAADGAVPRLSSASRAAWAEIDSLSLHEHYLAAFERLSAELERLLDAGQVESTDVDDVLDRMGECAQRLGNLPFAETAYALELARARQRGGDNHRRVAESLLRCASVARLANETQRSRELTLDAICLLDPEDRGDRPVLSRAFASEANWYRWVDVTVSRERFIDALETSRRDLPSPSFESADNATWLGWTLLHRGEHDLARYYLEQGRLELQALGIENHSLVGTIISAEADLDALDGNWADAETGYTRSTAIFERVRRERGELSTDLPLHGYNLLALMQVKQGRFDDAWHSLERYKGQISGRLIAIGRSRAARADAAGLAELREQLGRNDALARVRKESPGLSRETWQKLIQYMQLTVRLEAGRSEVLREAPLPDGDIDQLRARLRPDDAYLGWLEASVGNDLSRSQGKILTEAWVYLIRKDRPVEWRQLYSIDSDSAEYTPQGDYMAIARRASEWRLRLHADPALTALADEIAQVQLHGILDDVPDGTHLIVEFPTRGPWVAVEAMRDNDGRYYGDRYSVSYTPSAAVFELLSTPRRDVSEALSVLAVGDPVFDADAVAAPIAENSLLDAPQLRAALGGDAQALQRLPRLPFAGAEIDSISSHFSSSTVLRGPEASEARLNGLVNEDRLAGFNVIHVATHALVGRMYQRNALALSRMDLGTDSSNDGLVSVSEMELKWRLNADVVTLSCCQSAGAVWFRGDLLGFPHVLLSSGARNVIASLWKVDDRATALLMTRFYDNLIGEGGAQYRMSPAEALARARRWLRTLPAEDGSHPFEHPVYWSGFILVGDGR
ncbi:MAG TPA: CHAT domain-containing tetratricopeptide repeat protein [Candidatus Krumholzibacteria bacterium]|nr:CHAT domain-containing tetratricopeptide repeat protein [Candidatus Krumholzibacteria bacterium]